ncbi:MAG: hypothetical protein NTY36_18060 [Deltaproteobacteria bacterium]|nr:hypothetical protein [Deltaproteobacteria bacterium]
MDMLTFSYDHHDPVSDSWPGITCQFYFNCLPKLQCGSDDRMHFVIVRLSSFLDWGLSDDDLIKVLYCFARQEIINNPLIKEHFKELLPSNSPNKCSVDPNDIKFQNFPPFKVPIQRKIGF